MSASIDDLAQYLEPLRFSVVLRCPPPAAFKAFTEDVSAWWPLATHSVGQARARSCRIDAGAGGRMVEVSVEGDETTWAEVAAWEPPDRLVLRWHPGQPAEAAQEVEVRFSAVADGTRVDLEHRDWRRTAEGARQRSAYEGGWKGVLERQFAAWVDANEAAWRHAEAQ